MPPIIPISPAIRPEKEKMPRKEKITTVILPINFNFDSFEIKKAPVIIRAPERTPIVGKRNSITGKIRSTQQL